VFTSTGFAEEVKRDLTKQRGVEAYVDELTGFGTLEGITKSFTRVDVNDDNTPFLHRQINGRKNIWRAEFKNVRLKLKSTVRGFKDRYVRTFEVLIDPNTGHLLRIKSSCDVNDPDMLPEPPACHAEKQIKKHGEIYHGFPNEPPKANLLDALDGVGIGSPLLAKEIHAVYVLHSSASRKHRRVWVVTLRGIPYRPLKGVPPEFAHIPDEEIAPIWQRNRIRNVVDAVTGKPLFATTCPQPLPPKGKKKE
jgi:hypothetical protein